MSHSILMRLIPSRIVIFGSISTHLPLLFSRPCLNYDLPNTSFQQKILFQVNSSSNKQCFKDKFYYWLALLEHYGAFCVTTILWLMLSNLCLVKYNKERVFPVHIPEVGSLDFIQNIITSHYCCQDELTEAWCIQKLLFQLIEVRKNGHKCHITSERFIALLFRIHVNTGADWRCGAHAQITDLWAAQAPLFQPLYSVWGCVIFHSTEITVFVNTEY